MFVYPWKQCFTSYFNVRIPLAFFPYYKLKMASQTFERLEDVLERNISGDELKHVKRVLYGAETP